MLTVKENVLDRIEQSFEILSNNFKNIFLSYFLYKFIVTIIIGNIIYFSGINFIDLDKFVNVDKMDTILVDLFSNTYFLIGINIFIILILLNLILVIPFILATIKSIKQSYEGKKNINYLDNIKYGFKNLNNSFKTYWFMFAYVALIPSVLFIIGGLLLILGEIEKIDLLLKIGMFVTGIALILFLVFALYRGLKTSFSISSAVDYDEFSKENFNKSVKITKNNWWRIVGNFLLIGLIISLASGMISGIIGIFKISTFDFSIVESLMGGTDSLSEEKIKVLIDKLTAGATEFNIIDFFVSIIELAVEVVITVFMFIFTYLFYKRLELESNINNNNSNSDNISFNKNIKIKL